MTAYFIAVRKTTTDPAPMKTYLQRVGAASAGHEMKPLAAYGRIRVVEGTPSEGAVIIAFPTFEAAEAWYASEAYQDVVQLRLQSGDYETFIVEGIGAPSG